MLLSKLIFAFAAVVLGPLFVWGALYKIDVFLWGPSSQPIDNVPDFSKGLLKKRKNVYHDKIRQNSA